jgi:hypothetical protein
MACTFSQDAQTDRSARPQPMKAPEAQHFSPTHPTLPGQRVLRVGYVEDTFKARTPLTACFSILSAPAFVSDR